MRKEILEGSITKIILKLSWPMMLAFVINTAFNIIDAIYVGRISADALAAVSMAFPVIFLIISLGSGIGVGSASLIARAIGANDKRKADNVAEHSLLIAIFLSIIFALIGVIFSKQIFIFMGATKEILPLVVSYTNILFLFSFVMFIPMIANNFLRAEGNMKTPMYVMASGAILNIILDPIFIFVLGLGVKGAAIATVISRGFPFFFILWYLFSGRAYVKLKIKDFSYKWNIIKEIFFIGIPSSLNNLSHAVGMFVLTIIVSGYGVYAIAAFGIGFRLDSIAVLPVLGIMTAVITLTGQNIGANNFERAEKIAYKASLIGVVFSFFIGLLFFIFPKLMILMFNNDPQVIEYGISYLRIISFTYIFTAFSIVLNGAFLGAGKAYSAFILTVLRTLILSLPLAYLLSLRYEVTGIWIGMAIATIIASIVTWLWFRTGSWKDVKSV